MKYTEMNLSACTTTISQECTHATGWFGSVKTAFRRIRIFMCSDCGKLLQGKELKDWEKQ